MRGVMNHPNNLDMRIVLIFLGFLLSTGVSQSNENAITEKAIRAILEEVREASLNNDYYGTIKYYYLDSKLVYDVDTDPNSRKYEMDYDNFIPQIQLDLGYLKESEVRDEILQIQVASDGSAGTALVQSEIIHTLFGTRTDTIKRTWYEFVIVDGEIKIKYEEMELLKQEKSKSDS